MYSKIYLHIWGSIFNLGNFKFLHCQKCVQSLKTLFYIRFRMLKNPKTKIKLRCLQGLTCSSQFNKICCHLLKPSKTTSRVDDHNFTEGQELV